MSAAAATPNSLSTGDVQQYRWLILLGLITAAIMEVLDTTIVNVALPQMAGNLGATNTEIAWVSTSYILSNVIVLPMTAFLAGRFGRKNYLTFSIFLFIVASFFCGTSHTLGELVLWRFLQGAGGAALLSTAQATIRQIFTKEEQGIVQSIFIMGIIVAPTLGPTLGGWITDNYTWNWCFFINLPIGLISAFLVWSFLDDPKGPRKTGAVDWPGIGLLAVGLGSLQYLLEEGEGKEWFQSALIVRLAIVAAVCLSTLVWWQLSSKNKNPVIDFHVLRNRTLAASIFLFVALGFGLYGGIYLYPLFFAIEGQDLDGWSFGMATITLKEMTTGEAVKVSTPVPFAFGGRGVGEVALPAAMAMGTTWTADIECVIGSATVKAKSDVQLWVSGSAPDKPTAAATDGWPWDEELWPQSMKRILKELRETPPPEMPAKPATPVEPSIVGGTAGFSCFGVKDKMDMKGPFKKHSKERLYPDGGEMVPVKDEDGNEFGKVTKYSLWAADIEGTMRLNKRILDLTHKGRPNDGAKPHDFTKFDATQSLWKDVTDKKPWGGGSKTLLIPYRVLAIGKSDHALYYKKVFVAALYNKRLPTGEMHNGMCVVGDCGDMDADQQFDFFKGREDVPYVIDDGLGKWINKNKTDLPVSRIVMMGDCVAAKPAPHTNRRKKSK